jgi:Low temperature viability protein
MFKSLAIQLYSQGCLRSSELITVKITSLSSDVVHAVLISCDMLQLCGLSCSDLFGDEDTAVVVRCRASAAQSLSKAEKSPKDLLKIGEDEDDDEDDSDGSDDDEDDDDDEDYTDDDDDDFSMEDFESVDGKAKTALTSYSMSSSVMPRNAGLSLLDDRFEKV